MSDIVRIQTRCIVTHHRVCERGWDGYSHPPYQSLEELASFASHQATDESAIKLSDVQTDHSSEHQKDAMADDQPKLFTPPSGYADLKQPQKVLEELAVQLNLLPSCCFTLARPCPSLSLGFAPYRGCFLLGNSIADAIYESDEKRYVDGA